MGQPHEQLAHNSEPACRVTNVSVGGWDVIGVCHILSLAVSFPSTLQRAAARFQTLKTFMYAHDVHSWGAAAERIVNLM